MQVGLCELTLYFHGATSMRDKRGQLRRMIERTRQRWPVAMAETGEQDSPNRAKVGFAVIGGDRSEIDSQIDRVIQFMDELHLGERIGVEREILSWKGTYA